MFSTHTRSKRGRLLLAAGVFTCVLGTSAVTPPATAGDHGLTRGRLQQEVDRTLREAGFVGLSVELRDGDRRLRARSGHAKLGSKRPVPYGGYFRAASATKAFVATVVLQLVGEGRLALSDTVEEWLPGLVSGNGNDGSRITVRHLLQHTSGLYNYNYLDELGYDAETFERIRFDHIDPEQLVAGATAHPPEFQPGERWQYSNPNYVLAGMIIERVTGRPWSAEVHDRIVAPLALTHTYAPGDDPRLPAPHARTYQRFPGSSGYTDTTERNLSWAAAAGELISSERDLDRFFTALLTGRLLKPEQLAEMKDAMYVGGDYEVAFPGLHYGLGLMRQPLDCLAGHRWGHGGDLEGATVRNNVTADGRRSIVLNATGKTDSDEQLLRAEAALQKLIETALCRGTRPGAGG